MSYHSHAVIPHNESDKMTQLKGVPDFKENSPEKNNLFIIYYVRGMIDL